MAGRRHIAAVLHAQAVVQQHGGAGLAAAQQQGHAAVFGVHIHKGTAAEVIAGLLAAVGTVQHRPVLIKGQHAVPAQPAQPLGHAGGGAQLHRVALGEGQHIEVRGQLTAVRSHRRHRNAAAVR